MAKGTSLGSFSFYNGNRSGVVCRGVNRGHDEIGKQVGACICAYMYYLQVCMCGLCLHIIMYACAMEFLREGVKNGVCTCAYA